MYSSSEVRKQTLLHSSSLTLGGYYCATPGQGDEDGECDAGHYCELGVDTKSPTASDGHKGVGGVCPAGSYCPKGTATPRECDAGMFTASEGDLVKEGTK